MAAVECKHEGVETRFCPHCGKEMLLSEGKLRELLGDDVPQIAFVAQTPGDDHKLGEKYHKLIHYAESGTFISLVDSRYNFTRGYPVSGRHKPLTYCGNLQLADFGHAHIILPETAPPYYNGISLRYIIGHMAAYNITKPVGAYAFCTYDEADRDKMAIAELLKLISKIKVDLWYCPKRCVVKTLDEIKSEIPAEIHHALKPRGMHTICDLKIYWLPDWFDDMRERYIRTRQDATYAELLAKKSS